MTKVAQSIVNLITDMKSVYRNYGQGLMPWLVAFAVLVAVAVIGYSVVAVKLILEPSSPPDSTLPIAWLASMLALHLSMDIRSKLWDNYRTVSHEVLIIREVANNQSAKGKEAV